MMTPSRNILPAIPKAPRIPSDLAVLDSLCPIQHTFKHWGRLEELTRNSARMDLAAAATVAPPARRG